MEVASWKPADLLSFVTLVSSLPRAIHGGWKWQWHDAASLVVLTVAPLGSYTIDRFAENAVRFTIGVGALSVILQERSECQQRYVVLDLGVLAVRVFHCNLVCRIGGHLRGDFLGNQLAVRWNRL
jgi:hypothetical protein